MLRRLANPAAKGLFHRAVVQSGSTLRVAGMEESAKVGAAFLAALGLTKATVDRIQTLPLDALYAASRTAAAKVGYRPVVDGKTVLAHPFDPAAPAASADVPMLLGGI